MNDPVIVISPAVVNFNEGEPRRFQQINVYASGVLVAPHTRTAISPSTYSTVETA